MTAVITQFAAPQYTEGTEDHARFSVTLKERTSGLWAVTYSGMHFDAEGNVRFGAEFSYERAVEIAQQLALDIAADVDAEANS